MTLSAPSAEARQAELEAATQAVAEHARLQRRLERLTERVDHEARVLAEARRALGEESQDVALLESLSPTRIWRSLRGTRDDDLARERAEQQAAEYVVSLAEQRLAVARREQSDVRDRIAALGDVTARKSAALASVEEWVRATEADGAGELAELAGEVGGVRSRLAEVLEAVAACEAATTALEEAGRHLGKAQDWATYDLHLGGGLLAGVSKYDRLDQATACIRAADEAVRSLSVELTDVGIDGVGEVGIGNLMSAFDLFFDNFFTDLAVRDKIRDALDRVRTTHSTVARVGEQLAVRRGQLDDELARLAARREELLLRSLPRA